jgi:uncharacterized membrane protein
MFTRKVSLGLLLAAWGLYPAKAEPAPVPNKSDRPVRVLLAASAPTRDFQFLRTFLVREGDKKRVELTLYLQPPPGRTEPRVGIVADVPTDRLLKNFPDHLGDPNDGNADERQYNLSAYEVIVTFDLDWTRLKAEQLEQLKKWVEKGGGLVVIAGPVNTLHLGRPGAGRARLEPILDLLPVVLQDSRVVEKDRDTSKAWRLNFPASKIDLPFLNLNPDAKGRLDGWEEFFTGGKTDAKKDAEPMHGFYNYYPVKSVKEGAHVMATFADPAAKLANGMEHPYLVVGTAGKGRVLYLGAGETWRLRQHSEAFYERFWTGLIRFEANALEEKKKGEEPKK